jgi:hypothetical protein
VFTFNVFIMIAMQCGGGDAMFLSLAPLGECWMIERVQKIIEYRGANIA